MSYWGSYEDQLHGGEYPTYATPAYAPQYFANMSYFPHQHQQNYNVNNEYDASYNGSYPNGTFEERRSSQVTTQGLNHNREEATSNEPKTGTVKKKQSDYKNKFWQNGKKNERYGSGRTFNSRTKSNYKEDDKESYGQSSVDFLYSNFETEMQSQPVQSQEPRWDYYVDAREGSSNMSKGRNKTGQKHNDNKNQYQNRYRSNYYYDDSKRNSYRNRDSRYDSNDGRNSYYHRNSKGNRGNENESVASNNAKEEKPYWRNFGSRKCNIAPKELDLASQRERLEQMLSHRTLECLVCCEKIKHTDKIWCCEQCYHIFHLNCVTAWANSSKVENGWRCPACQNVCSEVPKQYTCYCGKKIEPRPVPGVIPHACGEPCMKKGRTCDHKCMILCHPGPCPDCNVMVAKPCGCGATTQTIKCSSDAEIICGAVCSKLLDCGIHHCQLLCHSGTCSPCKEMIRQICYCGKVGRKVACTDEHMGKENYVCGEVCEKLLSCGNHKCERMCHEGGCEPCARDVAVIKTCPCGRSPLEATRESCLDPIPCCDKICGKQLNCGQPAAPHSCPLKCHEGPCPSCLLTTLVRCRCGYMDKELPCSKVTTKADDARCEKKCTKKRLCGKHRCNQLCCIEMEHVCPLPCNRLLACGQHRCIRTCHSGRCPPCMETSFEELYCECGSSVLYPPIPCGTKPPICNKPCSRPRECGHEVNHCCHTGACPPCTVLCKRWCYGKHEQRSAIPCYQEDFSCGLPCGKPLSCGIHKCDKPCHLGPCPLPCKQKCTIKRALCGHSCGAVCHKPPCPDTPCKQMVPVTCPCGLQKSTKPCIELADEYKEIEMANLKEKMSDLMKEHSVDLTDMINRSKKPATLKILDCIEECRVVERNRRFALGLQIRNPDLTQKLTPRYSDFLRNWAKRDPQFVQKVHSKLTELVQLAKQSKQKSRSHGFESMSRDKRQFIHEYCEHFGCESAAYDAEPNRNVVATAIKDQSWLPSLSLFETIQRENGHRKVPGPVLNKTSISKSETTVALKLPGRLQNRPSTPGEAVDYFNNPPV